MILQIVDKSDQCWWQLTACKPVIKPAPGIRFPALSLSPSQNWTVDSSRFNIALVVLPGGCSIAVYQLPRPLQGFDW